MNLTQNSNSWNLATNSKGNYLYAAEGGGYIFVSSDYGNTFSNISYLSSQIWSAISIDESGENVVACITSGPIYIKNNIITNAPSTYPTSQPTNVLQFDTCSSNNSKFKFVNYYIVIIVLFNIVGVLLYVIRSKSTNIEQFSIFSIIFQMSMLGLDFISDFLYLYLLLSRKLLPSNFDTISLGLGLIFLIFRALHPGSSIYLIQGFFFKGKTREVFDTILDRDHLAKYGKEYAFVLIISLLESTACKFFPWKATNYCKSSGGYPTPFIFRLMNYGKIFQSVVSTVIQSYVFYKSKS